MSNTAKLKKKATELEQKKQFDKALQLYIQLLDEAGRDLDDADLQLYNRVGDLLMRQGNTSEALSYYEKAVDVYAERGFLNNAIALCSKILRQSPARTAVYYKLGKISANKGFKSDAKKNFLEYADRMQKAGQRDEAYRALKEFADLCPDQDDIRLMLAEMLSKENRKDEALDQLQTLYEKLEEEGRGAEARATLDRMKAIDPAVQPRSSGTYRSQKSNDLVFLDLSADLGGKESAPAAAAVAAPPPKRPTTPDIPALEGLSFHFLPEDGDDAAAAREAVEGLEATVPEAVLDDAAIDALLTMPEAVNTLEQVGELEAEIPPQAIEDLEPTAVAAEDDIDLVLEPPAELSGWEPTATDAPHASKTPILAPLIEDPLLSGSEFAELNLQNAAEPRPTPVHDLLLPTELPLLTPPVGGEALGPGMVAVDSPSPIELTALEVEATSDIDLESEMMAPISRTGDRAAIVADAPSAEAFVATDPLGMRVIATAHIPDEEPESPDLLVEATAEPLSDTAAGTDQSESASEDATELSEANEHAEELAAAAAPLLSTEEHDAAILAQLNEASIDAAFETAAVDAPPSDSTAVEVEPDVESVAEEEVVADGALMGDAPGFGDGDEEAGTFVPSPRLSALTLQPDSWTNDDVAEVLIDGEWRDEHVSDAVPATNDEPKRFDDLAAAMMWVPSDERDMPVDVGTPVAPDEDPAFAFHTPRSHLSFGGVEDQLRRRLELVPENWALRRQLGEVLLDSGDRDAGLYELDLAMVGYELSGDLHGAMEVADEIVRLVPVSVRHHQKRVEYAVRSGDRLRLVDAYMELGDALFRDGQADKAHAVYARVLELSPGHERATFALGTFAAPTEDAEPGRVGRPRGLTYITPEDAFAEWEAPAHVLGSFVSAKSGEQPATAEPEALPSDAQGDVPAEQVEGAGAEAVAGEQPSEVRPLEAQEGAAVEAERRYSEPAEEAATLSTDAGPGTPEAAGGRDEAVASEGTSGSVLDTESLRRAVERRNATETDSPAPASAAATEEPPILKRARSLTPVGARDDDFVDLGDWLRATEPEKTTRMVVEEARPSGDEQADFDDMLRRFKRGVAENVEEEDFASHYDLGVAYKEMGLTDEAIAQFQRALRGESHRIRSYEALGQCFVEKGQHAVASALLQRAVETSQVDDTQLVGVLYLLGYSMESMGRRSDAMRYYQRVFAVDIEFRDVAQRVAAMEH